MEREWTSTPGTGGLEQGDQTTAKISVNHGGCKNTIKFSDSRILFKNKGEAYDANNWKVELGFCAENKP